MADMTRYISFSVDQKDEGKYLVRKILMIAAYVIFCVGALVLFYVLMKALGVLIGVIFVALVLIKVIKPLTWKFVINTHRYTIQSGTWELYLDHGIQGIDSYYKRKIKEAECIVPMTEENVKKYVEGKEFGDTFDMRGSVNAEDAYIAIFPEEDGSKTLIEFVASNEALSIMKYYNGAATEVVPVSH